jgi:hypothetical protein
VRPARPHGRERDVDQRREEPIGQVSHDKHAKPIAVRAAERGDLARPLVSRPPAKVAEMVQADPGGGVAARARCRR